MTLNLTLPVAQHTDFSPRIAVIGVGGGGSNAVNNMIAMGLSGVEFIVANTDAQALMNSPADRRVQLGPHLTQGLGAGAKPEIGRAAAEEATEELARHLEGCHMVFVTAGLGGGTGTGAAPVIARMARERGILTVGVVTKPFDFEGARRRRAAEVGLDELAQFVDTLIVIPNQNLFKLANDRTTFAEAFKMADNVLYMGVRGVTDLMVNPGLINLDFADIRTVMAEMGKAMMGTGEAEGDDRAVKAAEAAISNPLLEDTSMRGARGVLINITGGHDMSLFEVDEATNRIGREVDPEANIIFGTSIDETLNGRVRVSVVATGIDAMSGEQPNAPAVQPGGPQGGGGPRLAVVTPPQGAAPAPARAASAPVFAVAARRPTTGVIGAPGLLRQAVAPAVVAEPSPAEQAAAVAEAMPQPVPVPRQAELPVAPPPAPPASGGGGGGFGSLFKRATGLMRRPPMEEGAQAHHQPVRVAPTASAPQVGAAARASQGDAPPAPDFEIPAFLRRQSN